LSFTNNIQANLDAGLFVGATITPGLYYWSGNLNIAAAAGLKL